jgi:hypothetical protein
VCTTPGTPQRWASASQCTNTRLPERAKPKKLRTRQSGIKPAGSMFCWMPGCCPTTHLAEDGSLDQAERCPVESWIVMSTTSLNTTHPPRRSRLWYAIAASDYYGNSLFCWSKSQNVAGQGRALIFFSQRPTSIPGNTYIHAMRPALAFVPITTPLGPLFKPKPGNLGQTRRHRGADTAPPCGGGKRDKSRRTRLFHHDSGNMFPVHNGFFVGKADGGTGRGLTR